MEDFWGRLTALILGVFIGLVVSHVVRSLQEIKEKVEEVDEHLTDQKSKWERNEHGFMRFPLVADVALLLALGLTVWASIASQRASNEVQETQAKLETYSYCNKAYLSQFLAAANEVREAGRKSAQANVDLQKSWYAFVAFQLHIPPYPEDQQRNKANIYADALKHFVESSEKTKNTAEQNPYPTVEQLDNCIQKEN